MPRFYIMHIIICTMAQHKINVVFVKFSIYLISFDFINGIGCKSAIFNLFSYFFFSFFLMIRLYNDIEYVKVDHVWH